MANIVGHWWKMLGNNTNARVGAYWEFKEDNTLIESDKVIGNWTNVEDMVVVKFSDENLGNAVLSFDGDNTVFGDHQSKNDGFFEWSLIRAGKTFGNNWFAINF